MATQDLSQLQQRQTSQGRPGGPAIPTPQTGGLGSIGVYADQRNAFRADSSEEVRRALGLLNQTVDNVGSIQATSAIAAVPQDRAAGELDATTTDGPIDPQKAKSLAYQDAYYGAKADAHYGQWQADTTQAVDTALNQGANPDQVHALVMDRVTKLRDQTLADYPTATARSFIANSVSRYAAALDVAVAKRFTEATHQDLTDTIGSNYVRDAFPQAAPLTPAAAPGLPDKVDPVLALVGPTAAPPAKPFNLAGATGLVASLGGRVTSTTRSRAQQDALVASGATSAVNSYHLTGHAVDFVPPAGLTLAAAKARFSAAGYDVREALEETGHGPNQGTGRHFHFAFGGAVIPPAQQATSDADDESAPAPASAPVEASPFEHIGQRFELAMGAARAAGIDAKTAKASFIQASIVRATDPTDPQPEAMLALAKSTQADGKTPSFTPGEQQEIQNAAIQAFNQRKAKENRQTQEAQDDLLPRLFAKVEKGEDVQPMVDAAVQAGTLSGSEGLAWLSHSRSAMEQQTKGELNVPVVTGLQVELTQPDADVAAIRSRVISAYNAGELGTGSSADRAFANLMQRTKDRRASGVNTPGANAARQFVNNVLHADRYDVQGPENRGAADVLLSAHTDLDARLRKGEDPTQAAHAIVDAYQPRLAAAIKAASGPPAPRGPGGGPPKAASNAEAAAIIRQQAARALAAKAELARLQKGH